MRKVRRLMSLGLMLGALLAAPAQGEQPPVGEGDYLVLAISWTPSWCALEGAARGAARCADGAGAGWMVHGLWPQFEAGDWPEFCDSPHPAPARRLLREMRDIMGSDGLAGHQWRKHGSCSGQSPGAYFAQTRAAFEALQFPPTLTPDDAMLHTRPDALLEAFRAANPGLQADMAVLTCRAGLAQEIRICLTQALAPRPCDARLRARACGAREVRLPPPP